MTAPRSTRDGGRIRFPALDPEPARRPLPWRLLASVAVVALAAAGAVELPFILGGQSHSPAGAAAGRSPATAGGRQGAGITVRGQVLAETPGGGLVLARPGGARVTSLRGLGEFPPSPPIASPDGRYLYDVNGRVISLAQPGRPAVVKTPLTFSSRILPAALGPFAGHDQYLVLRLSDYGAPGLSMPVELGSIATGKTVQLGAGDEAAGDPRAAGAFVSVAGPLAAAGVSSQSFPDARVELRDAGAKPVVLATARELDRAVGAPARLKVSLLPFPSPDGGKVAVEVAPLTTNSPAGVVVMTRSGRVLASAPLTLGADSGVYWNRAGSEFAYLTPSSSGQSLTVTTIGGGTQTQAIPVLSQPVRYRTCVWSPDGADVVCSDSKGKDWAVAQAAGGQVEVATGRGLPITWLP